MIRTAFVTTAVVASLLSAHAVATSGSGTLTARQLAGQVTVADAAPFIGDWTLALQGPNGPGAFALSLKVEKEKVTGEISNDQLPKQPIRDMSIVDKSLVLGYSFTWEGNPVQAVVSLTPAPDGKMTAQIDFAGGAYIMSGTATKKENPNPKQ
jgi:hypothetical protein